MSNYNYLGPNATQQYYAMLQQQNDALEKRRQQELANSLQMSKAYQQDPYYAWGNLIGTALMQNYTDRGVAKGTDAARKALAASDNASGGATPQTPADNTAPLYQQQAVNEQTQKSLADFASGVNDESVKPKNDSQLKATEMIPQQTMKQQVADSAIGNYAKALEYNPNARGDEVKANSVAPSLQQLLNTPEYDPATKRQAVLDAIKDRPQYQQEMILQKIAPELIENERKYNGQMATQLANAGMNAIQQGKLNDAQSIVSRLGRFDTQSANALQGQLDYAVGRRDKLADLAEQRAYQRAYRQEGWDHDASVRAESRAYAEAHPRAAGGSSGGKGTSGKQTIGSDIPGFATYAKAYDELRKGAKENIDPITKEELPFNQWPLAAQKRYQPYFDIVQAANPSATMNYLGYDPNSAQDIDEALQAGLIDENTANNLLANLNK